MEAPPQSEPNDDNVGLNLLCTLEGHTSQVYSVAWSPDGIRLASSSHDNIIRLWGPTQSTLKGHLGFVRQIAWSPDGSYLVSGSHDGSVWIWNAETGALLQACEKRHKSGVNSVAWSPDGTLLASSSHDRIIWLWDPKTGMLLRTLEGHTSGVYSVAWSPDGTRLASGSYDNTIRLWDPKTGMLLHTLKGHTSGVYSVAWSPDGTWLASGSEDNTIQLWDPKTGRLLRTLEGYTSGVYSVAWSADGLLFACASSRNGIHYGNTNIVDIYIWSTDTWDLVAALTDLKGYTCLDWHPAQPLLATVGQAEGHVDVWHLNLKYLLGIDTPWEIVHYTNAKVVLVGDSGVGKSGLGLALSGQPFTSTSSTHGRYIWNFDTQEASLGRQRRETRETLLWDLAGQPGYRLIHQLHLNEVVVALVVFDAHSETDPFAGVQYWDKALRLAQSIQGNTVSPLKKILVAARIDRGGIAVSSERMQSVVQELAFDGYFATSAQEGWQINELRVAICNAIDWRMLPKVTSTVLFRQIKQFLLSEKQKAIWLISSIESLYNTFLHTKGAPVETPKLQIQFEACIRSVESVGLIKRLSFGRLVLLQPELLDAYASALVNFVKDEPDGLGSIPEELVRTGDFRIPTTERIHDKEQEKLLLIAMIEELLGRELALREEGTLVFPSQSTKENPDLSDPEGKTVIFTFEGPVLNIYTTLAVRLARSGLFKKKALWKNAITYTSRLGEGICGMCLRNIGEGRGDLTLFFDHIAGRVTRHTFTEYVKLHLSRKALQDSLEARRVVECSNCRTVIPESQIERRKKYNPKSKSITCPVCDKQLPLEEPMEPLTMLQLGRTKKIDQTADIQRKREVAQSILQGKIATGDFDVFLCHNRIDKPLVKQIGAQLKERGILPWLDEWELRPGLPWQWLSGKQIEHIKTAAVFVGGDGIGPWQYQELEAFLREFVQRGCPVIPVLLPDAPYEPELPVFLRGFTWVDFRQRDPDPLQQLSWGITGKRDLE